VSVNFTQGLLSPYTVYTVGVTGGMRAEDGSVFVAHEWDFETAGDVGSTSQFEIDSCMSDAEFEMLAAANEATAQAPVCGAPVPPLSWSCLLQEAALRHSNDSDINGYPSDGHTDSDGSRPDQRISDTGYRWSLAQLRWGSIGRRFFPGSTAWTNQAELGTVGAADVAATVSNRTA
jgi:hypothetical protein